MDASFDDKKTDSATIRISGKTPLSALFDVPSGRPSPKSKPVRVEAPAPPVEPVEAEPVAEVPADPICPKCQGKLIDPQGLGWCMACGYCRSTAEESAAKVLAQPVPSSNPLLRKGDYSPLGVVEFIRLFGQLPLWFWLLVGGVAVAVGLSVAGNYLTPEDSYVRAVWSAAQVVLSLVILLAGQLWSLALIAPLDDRFGARDALIPFRLWHVTAKKVPLTRGPVCLGAWALSLLLCAIFLIGGFGYWLPKAPPKKTELPTTSRVVNL